MPNYVMYLNGKKTFVDREKSAHPFGQKYWPLSETTTTTSHLSSNTQSIASETNTREVKDYRKREFLISLCERCDTHLASVSCIECCLDFICLKCCHHLHSCQKRCHHKPTFLENSGNKSPISRIKDERELSCEEDLKTLCQNALLLTKFTPDSRQTKICELQKIRTEKRLNEIIEQEEAEKHRLEIEKKSITIQENNGARKLQYFFRNFLEKIRRKRPKDCIKMYLSSLFEEDSMFLDDSAIIIQRHFRSYSVRTFLWRLNSSTYDMMKRKQLVSGRVQNAFENRRIQQRADLIFRYWKVSDMVDESIHFHITKLNRSKCIVTEQMKKIKSSIKNKTDEINRRGTYLSNCTRKEDYECHLIKLKFNKVSQSILERKIDIYNQQLNVVSIQLNIILGLKKHMVIILESNQEKFSQLNARWHTVKSLVKFMDTLLDYDISEEHLISRRQWLQDQKLKMMSCISQYDTAQALILEKEVEKLENTLSLLIKTYDLVSQIIEHLRLEIGWEGERAGVELLLSKIKQTGQSLSLIERIKAMREKKRLLKETVTTQAYYDLEKLQEKLDHLMSDESIDIFCKQNIMTQQEVQVYPHSVKIPAISKENWIFLYESKPWNSNY